MQAVLDSARARKETPLCLKWLLLHSQCVRQTPKEHAIAAAAGVLSADRRNGQYPVGYARPVQLDCLGRAANCDDVEYSSRTGMARA